MLIIFNKFQEKSSGTQPQRLHGVPAPTWGTCVLERAQTNLQGIRTVLR